MNNFIYLQNNKIIINIYNFFLVISMCSLFYYFCVNINVIGGGSVAILGLLIFFVLCVNSILLRIFFDSDVYLKKSLYFLCLFFWYFLFRVIADGQELSFLISKTLNTSTGMILFLLIGSFTSFFLNKLTSDSINLRNGLKKYNLIFFIFLIFYSGITFYTSFSLVSSLSGDKLLIDGIGNQYQRPGNFLTISFYLFSFIYTTYNVLNNKTNIAIFIFYIVVSFTGMFNSQVFGSNSGLAGVGGISFITILFVMFLASKRSREILSVTRLSIKKLIISKLANHIYKYIILAIMIFILSLIIMMAYFDISFSMLRVSDFGSGNTSISSRLDLWIYFIENFSYSPFLGDLIVEEVVGTDNYVHSLIAYMLTHLGVLGTLLFLFYIFIAVNEVIAETNRENDIRVKSLTLYSIILFIVVFVLGILTTTMYWIVLWFSIGFTFSPFKLNSRKNHFKFNLL
ncbi:hypothetical protein [Methylophaga sp.]|uniref:hypothetical protein n=1 Tax=Methylophaga sp. TaxID=2024840 RepID=UPI003A940D22